MITEIEIATVAEAMLASCVATGGCIRAGVMAEELSGKELVRLVVLLVRKQVDLERRVKRATAALAQRTHE